MEAPPYEKKGRPLDASTNVKGYWIIYEYLFLFVPPPDQIITIVKLRSGVNCLGFNVVDMANAFQIPPGDLILNNQLGSLSVRWEAGVPGPAATSATNYIFGLPLSISGETGKPLSNLFSVFASTCSVLRDLISDDPSRGRPGRSDGKGRDTRYPEEQSGSRDQRVHRRTLTHRDCATNRQFRIHLCGAGIRNHLGNG
jgi:hypothetical protein